MTVGLSYILAPERTTNLYVSWRRAGAGLGHTQAEARWGRGVEDNGGGIRQRPQRHDFVALRHIPRFSCVVHSLPIVRDIAICHSIVSSPQSLQLRILLRHRFGWEAVQVVAC